jgi:hypothetical protein
MYLRRFTSDCVEQEKNIKGLLCFLFGRKYYTLGKKIELKLKALFGSYCIFAPKGFLYRC